MTENANARLEKIYKQSKLKSPYKNLSLIRRYWIYQWERLPLIPLILMGLIQGSAVMTANDVFSWTRLLAVTVLATAYLLQIRFADEPKDFEHDNKFYPTRPIQRGVITLSELRLLRNAMIIIFFVVALVLQSWTIFLLACLQQLYSLLTRKEFYLRDWLRDHFLTYMFSHYFQLLILSWLTISILQVPEGQKLIYFGFALLSIAVVEISRKMESADNKAGDNYSAALGITKSAGYFLGLAVALGIYTVWILKRIDGNLNALWISLVAVLFTGFYSYQYVKAPNKRNTKLLQASGLLCFFLYSITILVGA